MKAWPSLPWCDLPEQVCRWLEGWGGGTQMADGDALLCFQIHFEHSVPPPTCFTSDGNLIWRWIVLCVFFFFPCWNWPHAWHCVKCIGLVSAPERTEAYWYLVYALSLILEGIFWFYHDYPDTGTIVFTLKQYLSKDRCFMYKGIPQSD